jgi:hypothetical protein
MRRAESVARVDELKNAYKALVIIPQRKNPLARHRHRGNIILKCTLNLNSVNQLIFVMVKCGVLFEVRTESLNNI